MRKTILALGIISLLVSISCKKNEEQSAAEEAVPTENTQEMGTPPSSPEGTVDSTKADGTSVSVSSEGINVTSKDGDKKVEVNASKEGTSVEVKK
jgi:hypothetical protein